MKNKIRKEIKFRCAGIGIDSDTCESYGKIEKFGELDDFHKGSDDVILLDNLLPGASVVIDCDKDSGIFTVKFQEEGNNK